MKTMPGAGCLVTQMQKYNFSITYFFIFASFLVLQSAHVLIGYFLFYVNNWGFSLPLPIRAYFQVV